MNRDFSDYCTLLYPMMFLDTSGGISMYFYHAVIKIFNEWLYSNFRKYATPPDEKRCIITEKTFLCSLGILFGACFA